MVYPVPHREARLLAASTQALFMLAILAVTASSSDTLSKTASQPAFVACNVFPCTWAFFYMYIDGLIKLNTAIQTTLSSLFQASSAGILIALSGLIKILRCIGLKPILAELHK